jgi:hypothetical protein
MKRLIAALVTLALVITLMLPMQAQAKSFWPWRAMKTAARYTAGGFLRLFFDKHGRLNFEVNRQR